MTKSENSGPSSSGRNLYILVLIFFIFLVIALLSNVLGAIIPDLIKSFSLSLTAASMVHVCFWGAYGPVSIPAGMLVEKIYDRPVLLFASVLCLIGIIMFALLPVYSIVLPSFALIGSAMAMFQVSINPLMRVAGGAEHYAFNGALAQLIYGIGAGFSPTLYSYFVRRFSMTASPDDSTLINLIRQLTPPDLPLISLYWLFSAIVVLMFIIISLSSIPKVSRTDEERVGAFSTVVSLLKTKTVQRFTVVIFLYVVCEQGNSYWISQFLNTYHGFDPQTAGASVLSWYWWCLGLGCIGGMVALKFFDSRRVLVVTTICAITAFSFGLFGPSGIARYAFPMVGLFESVMWPIMFSLALNSVQKGHGAFSGILCTAIVGGAAGTFLIGRIGDLFGLRIGMMILFPAYLAILSVGFWARPLVSNKILTIKMKRMQNEVS